MEKNKKGIMKNKYANLLFYLAVAIVAVAIMISVIDRINTANNNTNENPDEKHKNYCTPESRKAEVCITLYEPVCGWFNETIKCVRYPCAATYSNKCFACQDPKVEYWTEGECPK